jgi:hypothetical protein
MQIAQSPKQAHSTAWIDERRAMRRHLGLPVMMSSTHTRPSLAYMVDVSSVGCRIEGQVGFAIGSLAAIEVKGFTKFEGWVVWQRPGELGVEFAHPLPEPVVTHLEAFVH